MPEFQRKTSRFIHKLGNTLPRLPLVDSADHAFLNRKPFSQIFKAHPAGAKEANLVYFDFGECGVPVSVPAFRGTVPSIIEGGTEKQMRWAEAWRVITGMQNEQTMWYRPMRQFIRYAMDRMFNYLVAAIRLITSRAPNLSITVSVFIAWPFQAGVVCWDVCKHTLDQRQPRCLSHLGILYA